MNRAVFPEALGLHDVALDDAFAGELHWILGGEDFHIHGVEHAQTGVEGAKAKVNSDILEEWREMEGMFNYPVITWDADTFDEWENGWPDPTFNGLLPNWTVDDLLEFLGMDDEDDWEKVWD